MKSSIEKTAGRIESIDVIRAVAALSVLFSHIGNPFAPGGWLSQVAGAYHLFVKATLWANGGVHGGVVVFIVLSGFCIHMSYAKNPGAGFDLRNFAVRRFFRIYPVLVAAMLLGVVAAALLAGGVPAGIARNLIPNLLLLPGIYPVGGVLGNEILDTVIIECLLYAAYPLGLYLVKRGRWKTLFTIALAAYLLNIAALAVLQLNVHFAQRNFWAFLVYWWIGAYAAEVVFSKKSSFKPTFVSGLDLAAIYLALSPLGNAFVKGFHYLGSLMLAVCAAYLLVFMAHYEEGLRHSIRRNRFVALFGRIGEQSYSLYVVHWPVLTCVAFWLSRSAWAGSAPWLVACQLGAVALVTALFYRGVEYPSHRLALSRARKLGPAKASARSGGGTGT